MRLCVIATDYDGTISLNGTLDEAVREKIMAARRRGIVVVLVTGRILSELRDVAGDLSFVDGIVAENGAVISLPNGQLRLLGRVPPIELLARLAEHGIEFKVGHCVVEMEAEYADTAISIIRTLQLPLGITFNRNRMMLLPASISKAAGLRELLQIIGLSWHNAIGIGDAENDHELLATCEFSVAVEWGSAGLKRCADQVISGSPDMAVAEYIEKVSSQVRLPETATSRHKLTLEGIHGQPPFEIGIRGRNALITGDPRTGKSWLAGLLAEQLILKHYTVYVFDPEGDYVNLGDLPDTLVLGGKRMLPQFEDLALLMRQGWSIVFNLSHLNHLQKLKYLEDHLPLVAEHRRARGFPHKIFLDECHNFLTNDNCQILLDPELNSYTLITYRPRALPSNLWESIQVVAATQLAARGDVDVLWDLFAKQSQTIGSESELANHRQRKLWYETLSGLGVAEAGLLPPTEETAGELRCFRVAPRLTNHLRHQTKYFELPVSPDRHFVFTENGLPTSESATSLRSLPLHVSRASPQSLHGHLKRNDFSRWIAKQFCYSDLADTVRLLESKYRDMEHAAEFADELSAAINKVSGNT